MDTGALAGDEITLTVPAEAAFARVARVCGGALAARLGFAYDDIEEMRLAVGEAWALVLGAEGHDGGVVRISFRVLADGMSVDLRLEGGSENPPVVITEASAAAATMLANITDLHLLGHDGRSVHLEKRR